MSSFPSAVNLRHVTKVYPLYGSPAARALGVAGLKWLLPHSARREFTALDDVSLQAAHGERVAIIGRNGAGKTTLLRLVQGLHRPSSGEVAVAGRVQAMMDFGIGFHPEFSGLQNIRAALTYSGLPAQRVDSAIEEIVEFCELGEFLMQPLRTYSAGMKMRLFFAVATAIVPDILVIDEVLGAGDHYFAARAAARLRDLARSGCTLLLVSHSMQQVIEFCERALWLESGRVVLHGPALAVVRAYEEFIQRLTHARRERGDGDIPTTLDVELRQALLDEVLGAQADAVGDAVSRWPATGKIRITRCWARRGDGVDGPVAVGAPFDIVVEIQSRVDRPLDCRFAIVIFSRDGHWLTRMVSPPLRVAAAHGTRQQTIAKIDQPLLPADRYVMSVSVHEAVEPWDIVKAERYDLISRSIPLEIGDGAVEFAALARLPTTWSIAAGSPS